MANGIPRSASSSRPDRHSEISWPLERPTRCNNATASSSPEQAHRRVDDSDVISTTPSIDIFSGQAKALDGIVLRGFCLGTGFGVAVLSTFALAYYNMQVWRVPFFVASLCMFHFLEFFITARYNTPKADVEAFLLSTNGRAWNFAHGSAMLECLITCTFFPSLRSRSTGSVLLSIGLTAMFIGQFTRSAAMAAAGTNFNHQVQAKRNEGHTLVTTGVYSYLRHPSYFGFFWWGLGTQIVLGNVVCFIGYAYVLWRFFNGRIRREEQLLVDFFGDQYTQYRSHSFVGIPFIR